MADSSATHSRHRPPPRRVRPRAMAALAGAIVAAVMLPGLATAHPLGNFTINHYAGIRVEPDRVLLDVVTDQAEIPTFQARLGFDSDGDGDLSDAETEAGRVAACRELAGSLDLRIDDRPVSLSLTEAGLAFPPGAGGLATMRSVCGFAAALDAPITAGRRLSFADHSFADRLGWREIVVAGSGVRVSAAGSGELRTASVSERLTRYPVELLAQALADAEVAFVVIPGGPVLQPLDIPDAGPVSGAQPVAPISRPSPDDVQQAAAVVPGGVGAGDLPAIFRTADLTPIVLLVSVLTAAALGAGHALTPGHGKTLMAAYLVGTRGTPAHAAGLGLSVALSHTLGILVLAAFVVGAQGLLPPELVVRVAPIVAAVSIVAIGGWMLLREARRRLGRGEGADHHHAHDHGQGEHSHGGLRHSHLPVPGSAISWRSLFVLGLAGGLIPSASALLILLGSIAAGRPAFGFVLVVAFGLGMALVMAGIGLALVIARGRLDRVDASSRLGRASNQIPLAASVVVLGVGLYLTLQALSGATTL